MTSQLNVSFLSVRNIIIISTACSISPDGSSSESAVEEETVGLSVPDEEEEGSVCHELDVRGPSAWNDALHDSSGCACFCSLLVHVDVGQMEDVHHPQFTAAAGDVREFGLVFDK